jgi:hypothetical protein
MIKCSSLKKKKEKNKNGLKAKVYVIQPFFVLHSRHHIGVSDLGSIVVLLREEILS